MVFLASDESSYMIGTELVIGGSRAWGQWWLADTDCGCGGDWALAHPPLFPRRRESTGAEMVSQAVLRPISAPNR